MRSAEIGAFLDSCGWGDASRTPLAGDASARRYERLRRGGQTAVLMDAPPDTGQDIGPFLAVDANLRARGLSAPEILAADPGTGLILMEDLGDALFAREIAADPARERPLYLAAVGLLAALDRGLPGEVPAFPPSVMAAQIAPVFDWYAKGLGHTAAADRISDVQGELETLLARHSLGPNRLLLRDFHAENLIWLPGRSGLARVGLLDFQDAMAGPPGYDLVSLLTDARRDVTAPVRQAAMSAFADLTGHSMDALGAACAVIGVQRNLRILGIFARLSLDLGKPRYVELVPRVWNHVQAGLAHPALSGLAARLGDILPPPKDLHRLRPR